MPVIDVFNIKREKVGELELSDFVFNAPNKPYILHEVVRMQLAKKRAGTASTKGRSEVSGGGRKPWRQKGTGRARAGTIRSPLWRGGGVVFGPKPRKYELKVPKKVRKLALRIALSNKVRENQMMVLDQFALERIKTKDFLRIISELQLDGRILVVTNGRDERVEKSARNIPWVKVLPTEGINVFDLMKYENLLLSQDGVGKIEEALGR